MAFLEFAPKAPPDGANLSDLAAMAKALKDAAGHLPAAIDQLNHLALAIQFVGFVCVGLGVAALVIALVRK